MVNNTDTVPDFVELIFSCTTNSLICVVPFKFTQHFHLHDINYYPEETFQVGILQVKT